MADPPRKNAETTRGRRFQKGNPGRPKGSQNRTTRMIEALLEGEAEAIGRKCIEKAKAGDPVALRRRWSELHPLVAEGLSFSSCRRWRRLPIFKKRSVRC